MCNVSFWFTYTGCPFFEPNHIKILLILRDESIVDEQYCEDKLNGMNHQKSEYSDFGFVLFIHKFKIYIKFPVIREIIEKWMSALLLFMEAISDMFHISFQLFFLINLIWNLTYNFKIFQKTITINNFNAWTCKINNYK